MFEFIKEYIHHPMKVGAVVPSSKYLAACMMKPIDFDHCDCIVEYGPGTGVFTKEIIARKKEHTKCLIIEENRAFYEKLVMKYGKINGVHIIHGKAEHMKEYMEKYNIASIDYIVSGLPFTSLPKEVSTSILEITKQVIDTKGRFITFQYSMFKRKMFEEYFKVSSKNREYRNFPPAYILVMEKGGVRC